MKDSDSRRRFSVKKPKMKHKEAPTNESEQSTLHKNLSYITTFFLLVFTLLIYDVIVTEFMKHKVDFQALKTELTTNVFNQAEAVSAICRSLDKYYQSDTVSAVNFIGSTGVGKTFASKIVKRHFCPTCFESRGPFEANSQQNIIKEIGSKYNLLVFDDLTVRDVGNLTVFIKKIPKDVKILVISIFNIQETDDFLNYAINYEHINTIENKFKEAEISHETAKFQELGMAEANEWVVKQLVSKGIEKEAQPKIVESVLNSHNIKFHGLKGLHVKLNLEL